jgi:hypothetical protein
MKRQKTTNEKRPEVRELRPEELREDNPLAGNEADFEIPKGP